MPTPTQKQNNQTDNPGCLAGLLRLIGLQKPEAESRNWSTEPEPAPEELPYHLRDDFLSDAEASFYQVIKGMMGGYFAVCPKVSLSDILYVPRRHENFQAYHNKIDRKHIDFLICEAKTMQPRFAIELDDGSHERADRIERDEFVECVFQTAGLPLLRLPVRKAYNTVELGTLFKAALEKRVSSSMTSIKDSPASEVSTPFCPRCGERMVKREARRGVNRGNKFYGCSNYPQCKTIISIEE